jgi:2-polyprenyl-3-methyl-5-hydroxy-6-metoxy-1,4-benzoquinol methylase
MEVYSASQNSRIDQLEYVSCDICRKDDPESMFQEDGFYLNRCNGCGHFYVSPRPTEENTPCIQADDFPAPRIHANHELSRTVEFKAYVAHARKYVAKGTWLDVGCGCGTLLGIAARAGFVAEGVETDAARAAYCKKLGFRIHDYDDIMGAFAAPFSYDVITLVNVFSHLRSPMTTFASLYRLLRKGGVIIVATSQVGKRAYKSEVPDWHIPDHLHFAGPRTFKMMADSLGFELECLHSQLTQKSLLLEKLGYRSDKRYIRAAKKMLIAIPRLVDVSALGVCCAKRYIYARHEVVMLFVKRR